ncbi:ATP-binding protein [Actinoplanes sp. CA-252034]|uniref:ATP-binding protein n=1 Tax=Actinoplanes sp. CA-252034 TaxID=3239906 RepID=UPI003D968270
MSEADDSVFTLAELESILGLDAGADDLGPYLDAAAVLEAFDPLTLRPAGPVEDADGLSVIDSLLPRCEPVSEGAGRGLWTLTLADRRARLATLGTRTGMRDALRANPDHPDLPVQRMFELVLDDRPISPAELSRPELAALVTLHDWLDGILDVLPPARDVLRALARDDVTAPMRRLVAEGFVGRSEELLELRRYVLDDSPFPAPLVFVHGPGGVGKSTLLAQLLLTVAGMRLPVAYVDIDRPTVRPDRPTTLVLAMFEQLAAQLDIPPGARDALLKELAHLLRRQDDTHAFESNLQPVHDAVRKLLEYRLGDRHMLVVVDTFEEAQYLGGDVVWLLLDFLRELLDILGGLRIVVAGRALPRELSQVFPGRRGEVDLGVLDQESARDLLRRPELPGLSVADLDDVIAVVSRNPMCLKLAVRLLRDEGVERLRESRSDFLTHLRAEKIQALLYGRILRHLHSDTARAVAFPGLVVRRITPGVVRDVLAGPCGLDLRETTAEQVVRELGAEVALVGQDADGSLRHRADVRRSMLQDLTDQVREEVVTEIDQGAVAYYATRDDPVSRAEEIYHRLRLRQPADVLDVRWLPAAADHLRSAVEEVPPAQRLWLARHLGITLDDAVRRAASLVEWEDQAGRIAGRYLQAGRAQDAVTTLRERADRSPRSPLYALEAEALRFLSLPDEALRVARTGVEAAIRAGAVDMALDLLLKMTVIEEGRGRLDAAAGLADEAADVSRHSVNEMLVLQASITGLRLRRRRGLDVPELTLTDDQRHGLQTRPVLLREAAAELAADDPGLAASAIQVLGFDVATPAQTVALAQAVIALTETVPDLDPAFLTGARGFLMTDDTAFVETWVHSAVTSREIRQAASALARADPGARPLPEFQDYFRAGVDSSLTR